MIELIQKYVSAGSAVKLAAQIEGLVRAGKLLPEALLPSVRSLAETVGVSPGTAAAAYRELRHQGVITTDGRRGTRVTARPTHREYVESELAADIMDMRIANPDPALLPSLATAFASLDPRSDMYDGAHVNRELAATMAAHFEADGVDGRELTIVSGAIAALHRALRACLRPGDRVAVEDPGFNEHVASVVAHGMLPVAVELDDEGMVPASLAAALKGGAACAILTPRLQSPTGAVVSEARAAELRAVFRAHPDVLVLIDDYASLLAEAPYHHVVDGGWSRWMTVRSFNKAVSPDLRVAVAVGDGETIERLRREQWLADGWVSAYLQRVAAFAMLDGCIQDLLGRARRTYAARRGALLRALRQRGFRAQGESGLNAWIPVNDEAAVVAGLLARGFGVRAGARYRIRSLPAIRITTARLHEGGAERLADELSSVVRDTEGSRGP